MINFILETIKEVGKLASEKQDGIKAVAKEDSSPVTEIDLLVSEMIRGKISVYTNLDNHMFVDEEFEEDIEKQWIDFEKAEYSWFIDPIAGTMSYLNGLPFYAISIGVLKNKKPYCGAIYLPSLSELYWHENGKAYFQNKNNKIIEMKESDSDITKFSLFYINMHQRFSINENLCRSISVPSINYALVKTAEDSFKGTLMKVKSWDIAASMGICFATGLGFFNLDTGEKIDEISSIYFDKNWKQKFLILVCAESNFDLLKKNIVKL